MRIILLATDETPKLAPLTDSMPTPLIPVVNRPLISIALELVARAGNKQALVSVYNRSGSIASYVNAGQRWGMSIDYLTQREPLGSAGSLRWAGQLLNETFLVLPVDAILDLDIESALTFHRSHGGPATVITKHQALSSDSVALDVEGSTVRGVGATSDATAYTTGAYIFEPSVLPFIPAQQMFDNATQLLPTLLAAQQHVYAFKMAGYWNPLQTFPQYQEAQHVFLMNAYHKDDPAILDTLNVPHVHYPFIEGRQIAQGIWVGFNDTIHPSAQLAAPVCIGNNCWIGRETEIGPGVVLGANVVIDDEATVERASVFDRTYVGRLLKLSDSIAHHSTLINTISSESTDITDGFLLSKIGAEAASGGRRRLANALLAIVLLVATSPLLCVLGLLALLGSGRVFERERRIGSRPPTLRTRQETGPHAFSLLRFATTRADGSATKLGRWLQQCELTSLAGLFNVVRAECELVGVKPLLPNEANAIQEAWQQKHYDRPAGLTGTWLLQTNNRHDLDQVLVADAYYVSVRTTQGDILLLWQTLRWWFQRHLLPREPMNKHIMAADANKS